MQQRKRDGKEADRLWDGWRKHYKHNIDIHCLALPLVFTVATLTSYTLSEWDLTPYDSVTARQSLTQI